MLLNYFTFHLQHNKTIFSAYSEVDNNVVSKALETICTFHKYNHLTLKYEEFPFTPQQSANINAISGGWDKKRGVDNGCFGQSVNRYTLLALNSVHCATVQCVIVCSKTLFYTVIVFLINCLYLHINGIDSGDDVTITIHAWKEAMEGWRMEKQLQEEKLSLCNDLEKDNSYVWFFFWAD